MHLFVFQERSLPEYALFITLTLSLWDKYPETVIPIIDTVHWCSRNSSIGLQHQLRDCLVTGQTTDPPMQQHIKLPIWIGRCYVQLKSREQIGYGFFFFLRGFRRCCHSGAPDWTLCSYDECYSITGAMLSVCLPVCLFVLPWSPIWHGTHGTEAQSDVA